MPEWKISTALEEYEQAVAFMEARVEAIKEARGEGLGIRGQEARLVNRASHEPAELRANGQSGDWRGAQNTNELIWLLEHPPLYTSGTSAKMADLLQAEWFPVYQSGRGGQFTYHGPGQRVGYVMLDLKARYAPDVPDLRDYVQKLERWLIATLAQFDVQGEVREGRIGVWVVTPQGEKKIAALGVRVRHGVSYHGVALNVNPDLSHFSGIVPCGIREHGVTSLHDVGVKVDMREVDAVLKEEWERLFG